MITIDEVMTQTPITLTRYNSLADARRIMKENRFRHIPIVNEFHELQGLVTQRTLYQHSVSSQTFMDESDLAQIETGTLLFDIMVSPVVTISPNCSIRKAAQIIHQKKFGCLPVVDDSNKLVGIVTDHDFVAITIHLLKILEDSDPLEIE